MATEIKIMHKEWNDHILLLSKNRLSRHNIKDEYANYILNENFLYIEWDKWDSEIFVKNDEDNTYYYCTEYIFNHSDWKDTCFIDNINKFIYRKSNHKKGIIKKDCDENFIIEWINSDLDLEKNKSIKECIEYVIEEKIENNKNVQDHNIIKSKYKIPNIIHFIYGFKIQEEEFNLYRYISIKSALEVNKPDKIYFYYHYEPYGYLWDKIKPFLTLEKIELPTQIFNNELCHYAHQADIIRLEKLIEKGGIYLDIDTICLRSFTDLLNNDFVMGVQTNFDNSETYGLCNAVMLSKPNSEFLLKWYNSYETFRSKGRDTYWDEHSVLKPLELSKIYPNEITILPHNNFFYPLWYSINTVLFSDNFDILQYKDIISNSYCIHLWDTYNANYLKMLSENMIFEYNSLYNIFCRKFLRNKISLVFLTHNRLDMTKKCLESYLKCLDMEYIYELIILDNNSDDETVSYLKEFSLKHDKILLILSTENLGVCHGRIVLFNEAKGDIIISLDSDAYLIDNHFFDKIIELLYDEKYGIIGISGAYLKSWNFGTQEDIKDHDEGEYIVDHIAGCCQAFRRDLFHFNFGLDTYYGKFWVEDTDLSMQSLYLNKINYRIPQKGYIEHHWGGSGSKFKELFEPNWIYFSNKWKGKVLKHLE